MKKDQFNIFREPGFTGEISEPVPIEHAIEPCQGSTLEYQDRLQHIEHSICDEPALKDCGIAINSNLSYEYWLADKWRSTRYSTTWLITFGIAIIAGPFAVLAVFLNAFSTNIAYIGVFSIVAFGPMVEEITKIALIYYIVEKKPYLFHSFWQIIIAALAGGLVFAVIENIIYLNIYIPNPTEKIIQWRWTVCTILHVGCSVIASLGLVKMWLDILERKAPARLEMAYPYIIAAIIIHGCYNAIAIALELAGTF